MNTFLVLTIVAVAIVVFLVIGKDDEYWGDDDE